MPFEIPSSWVWATVNDISKSILYGVSESAKSEGKYKLLRITDIQDNQVDWGTVPFTDFDEDKVSSYILHDGDIVFARTGATVGKSYLIKRLRQNAIYASYLIRVQTFDLILPEYVKLFFESGYYWDQIELGSVGIGQPNVNGTILGNLNIPLPSFAEQKRIVLKIERWFSLIDQIEQSKADLQTTIKQTKSKILDLAIHGKLVPQDPNDEPAIELLKRINPDFTPCDNGHSEKFPYDIPATWVWCGHNSILDISGGAQPSKSYFETTPKPNYVRLYQIRDYGESPVPIYIPINFASKQTEKGDILLARYGGSLGKVFHAEQGAYNVAMAKVIFKFDNLIYKEFAFYYYLSDLYQGKLKEISRTAQAGFNSTDFNDMYFPLPPLAEQQRIVSKIEELYSILDNIQKALEV